MMNSDAQDDTLPELDHAKLLGFRNLAEMAVPDGDVLESADLAFTKRGTESVA